MFFRRTAVNGVTKGFLTFQGFGIVERAERLTQFDQRQQASFSNYVYDLAILSLTDEHETFNWDWINARRNPARTDDECLKLAPRSWQRWLQGGASALPRNRRHVSKLLVTKPKDQLPEKGSHYDHILQAICAHYANKKHHFEGLAYAITLRWSRLFGQFGGEVKLIPGFDHAASWSVFVGGASPASGCISFAR
jgi:hypothetical protein